MSYTKTTDWLTTTRGGVIDGHSDGVMDGRRPGR